ncbi:zinc finger BED domain-containing protein 5-like [Artemia franciscana]
MKQSTLTQFLAKKNKNKSDSSSDFESVVKLDSSPSSSESSDDEETAESSSTDNQEARKRKSSLKPNKQSTNQKKLKISNKPRKIKNRNKFCDKWKMDPELGGFISKSDMNSQHAHCNLCKKDIRGSIYNVKRHVKSTFHKQNVQAMTCTVPVDQFVPTPEVQKKQLFDDSVKDAELRLAGWVAKEDISIRKTDSLLQVMKSCFPNDALCQALASSRTKTTGIIKNVLATEEKVQLANWLRNNKFAIIVDESTDKSWAKVLVIIAKYVDANYNVREGFLGLVDVHDASSAGQKNLIMKCLSDLGIPIQNLMGIGFDNASVNTGSVKGLGVLLKVEVPNLFILDCTSHSLALCATYAAKKLPEGLEVFIHDIVNYIASSPKRQDELKKCQEFARVESHRLLQVANTRWLSLEASVKRILEQWSALMRFFASHGEGDAAGDKSSKEKASRILACMKDPKIKGYLYFIAFVLEKVNELNIEFQSSKTRIHRLLQSFRVTYLALLRCFVTKEAIAIAGDPFRVKLIPPNFLKLEELKLGPNTLNYIATLSSAGQLNRQQVQTIHTNCLSFLVEMCLQVSTRIDYKDETLVNLRCIDPTVAVSGKVDTIVPLMIRFPNLLGDSEGESDTLRDKLEVQWTKLADSKEDLPKFEPSDDPGIFWKQLSDVKDCISRPVYLEISKFMLTLCALPHSSASAERKFSILNNLKTKIRNRLQTETVTALMFAKQYVIRRSADAGSSNSWKIDDSLRLSFQKWKGASRSTKVNLIFSNATGVDQNEEEEIDFCD